MSKKYTIITYGCQMNEHDSEQISYILENLGYTYTNNKKESDFIIYNTCLIRENAELKVYGQLGSLKNLKKEKKDLIIAVCGCMMQTGNCSMPSDASCTISAVGAESRYEAPKRSSFSNMCLRSAL